MQNDAGYVEGVEGGYTTTAKSPSWKGFFALFVLLNDCGKGVRKLETFRPPIGARQRGRSRPALGWFVSFSLTIVWKVADPCNVIWALMTFLAIDCLGLGFP